MIAMTCINNQILKNEPILSKLLKLTENRYYRLLYPNLFILIYIDSVVLVLMEGAFDLALIHFPKFICDEN